MYGNGIKGLVQLCRKFAKSSQLHWDNRFYIALGTFFIIWDDFANYVISTAS